MLAARQLRALTASCRALSSRTVCMRSAQIQSARLAAAAFPQATRSLFVSAPALGEGASDGALSQRLQEEIKYEKEAVVDEDAPEFLKAFNAEQIWTIVEEPGLDEISLTRTFGNEQIRVMFSIADIDTSQPDPEYMDGPEGEANEAEHEDDSHAESPSYPVRTSITITKPGATNGALAIDTVCQDGAFAIDNIAFYQDSKLATELTAEADWKRRGLYIGPQFDHLDVNVQEEVEKFLRERGIAEGLALFIPEYSEYKEQKEYIKWLEGVKKFVDV